jgi:hypothetical protein
MMADLNIEKPTPLTGFGEHADVVLTKDAITIARDEAVNRIAQRSWNDAG